MNEELQKKYLEFQLIQQQVEQIQQQQALVENQLAQLVSLKGALEELKKSAVKSDMLAPLGAGVYAYSSLNENEHVLMNIGARTAVRKSVPDAQEIVSRQIEEVRKFSDDIQKAIAQFASRHQELQQELQKEAQKGQKAENK